MVFMFAGYFHQIFGTSPSPSKLQADGWAGDFGGSAIFIVAIWRVVFNNSYSSYINTSPVLRGWSVGTVGMKWNRKVGKTFSVIFFFMFLCRTLAILAQGEAMTDLK